MCPFPARLVPQPLTTDGTDLSRPLATRVIRLATIVPGIRSGPARHGFRPRSPPGPAVVGAPAVRDSGGPAPPAAAHRTVAHTVLPPVGSRRHPHCSDVCATSSNPSPGG
ncbi:hypothetical protein GCM10017786_18350 [Amycolatopsis deserti]|uniref:Uncharacterized protein n=1 Tax=Amycolatopsis deserti TaxID=185696 RepID=A0ABQ3IKC3_9PSEU|nr:hypothetical protein GCM10017786_18350 [Amycolatopsis deserti]